MLPPDLVLFTWPLVVILLFRFMSFKSAVVWSIVAGYLLLPSSSHTSWDVPLLPPVDKRNVPALATAVVAAIILHRMTENTMLRRAEIPDALTGVLVGWLPRSLVGQVLIVTMVIGVVMTVQTNEQPLVYGPRVITGLGLPDILAMSTELGFMILPFLIGRKFLSNSAGHKILLVALCVAGSAYAVLAMYEVRMSPQLNTFFYGFFPHSWTQHLRGGGFRPLVFLDHGLRLGIFLSCATIAAAVLTRIDKSHRPQYFFAFLWLFAALFLSKTLGAFLSALILIPVAFLFSTRLQLLAAAVVAIVVLTYPLLRSIDLVPTDAAIALAERVDTDRAASLLYRFENEDILLDKARERPLFGWGKWSRARVFDENGNDISTTDGAWVILIGENGWIGYITQFGLLTIPIVLLAFRSKRDPMDPATAGLALALSAILLDLLPNSPITPVLFLIAGALIGRLEIVGKEIKTVALAPSGTSAIRHTRFPTDKIRGGHQPIPGRVGRGEVFRSQASKRSKTTQ